MRTIACSSWLVCALFTTACGGEDRSENGHEDPARHACEQVAETGTTVHAGTTRAAAETVTIAEAPWAVQVSPGVESFLRLDGGIDALVFTRETGVVTGLYFDQETTNQLPAPEPNELCPAELPEHFDLELAAPGAWYLKIGPVVTDSVWLAITPAAGHGHE